MCCSPYIRKKDLILWRLQQDILDVPVEESNLWVGGNIHVSYQYYKIFCKKGKLFLNLFKSLSLACVYEIHNFYNTKKYCRYLPSTLFRREVDVCVTNSRDSPATLHFVFSVSQNIQAPTCRSILDGGGGGGQAALWADFSFQELDQIQSFQLVSHAPQIFVFRNMKTFIDQIQILDCDQN